MNGREAFLTHVHQMCQGAMASIADCAELAPFVRFNLPPPLPFYGSGEIRLVILGQDPTIRIEAGLGGITTVLTLDQPGNLRVFVERICNGLGISLDENVYATNLCKCFFVQPPVDVLEPNLLQLCSRYWLSVLQYELAAFPNATIITLGEGVLKLVAGPNAVNKVKAYWGYYGDDFSFVFQENSALGRTIYPFIHQPSLRQNFYAERFDDYLGFVRQHLEEVAR